jgi:hypothetical protein
MTEIGLLVGPIIDADEAGPSVAKTSRSHVDTARAAM